MKAEAICNKKEKTENLHAEMYLISFTIVISTLVTLK